MGDFRQRFFQGLVALVACLAVPAGPTNAQPLTEEMIHATSDTVRPETKAYRFVRNFDHRYKCSTSTSAKKLQANKTLTRLEFVEVLQDCNGKLLQDRDEIAAVDAQVFDEGWLDRGFLAPFAPDMQFVIVDGILIDPPNWFGKTRSSKDDSSGERHISPGIDKLKPEVESEAEIESEDPDFESEDPEFETPDSAKQQDTLTESKVAPDAENDTSLVTSELPAEEPIPSTPATARDKDVEPDGDSASGLDDPESIATEEGGNPGVVEPPLVVAELPEIKLETFDVNPIDADRLVAEALSQIEKQGRLVTADQIPLDLPHPACVRLPAAEQAACFRLAAVVDRYRSAKGQLACLDRCESKRASYTFDQWLIAAGRRTVEREYAARIDALGAATDETDRLGQEIDELAAEIEETARGRQVYVYENTNTGEIIQHFGNKFTPVAPLVYRGEALLPLNEVEQQRLEEKRERLAALRAERSEKLGDLAVDNDLGFGLNWPTRPRPPRDRQRRGRRLPVCHSALLFCGNP